MTEMRENKTGAERSVASPIRLRSEAEWRDLVESSKSGLALLFKHSPSCSISSFVFEDFRRFLSGRRPVRAGLVLVVEDRELSRAISRDTGIGHESPQLIVLDGGQPVWHASHWGIDLEEVERVLGGGGPASASTGP